MAFIYIYKQHSYSDLVPKLFSRRPLAALDDWRNALDDRHSSFAPEMTHLVRQLGVHAVAGMPKGMTEIHI